MIRMTAVVLIGSVAIASASVAQQDLPSDFKLNQQPINGSETWKEATFRIPYPRFADRSNGADFRFGCRDADLAISYVALRRSAGKQTTP